MRSHPVAMNAAPFDGHAPTVDPPTVAAALGPKMIATAGELADGIHPFLTAPDHTGSAGAILGHGEIIAVEQGVIVGTDPASAREAARTNLARYLQWPNYRDHFLRSGCDEDELAAGADHVAVQIIDCGLDEAAPARELALALLG